MSAKTGFAALAVAAEKIPPADGLVITTGCFPASQLQVVKQLGPRT